MGIESIWVPNSGVHRGSLLYKLVKCDRVIWYEGKTGNSRRRSHSNVSLLDSVYEEKRHVCTFIAICHNEKVIYYSYNYVRLSMKEMCCIFNVVIQKTKFKLRSLVYLKLFSVDTFGTLFENRLFLLIFFLT